MSFDWMNIKPDTRTMTRGEVLAHAAAEIASQLTVNKDGTQRMPPNEAARLMLIGVIGLYKFYRLGAMHQAVSDLRECWEQVNPSAKDPNNIVEVS
jgi:hypothetical protein